MFKNKLYNLLRWSEKYTKTDMVYLVKNSFWVNANVVIISAFMLLISIMFARFISKETYGTYQFLVAIGSIIAGTTLMGMNNAVTQAVARGFEGVLRASIKEQLHFALIPFFIGLVGSLYYLFFGNYTLSLAIIIIAVLLPISNTFNTWAAYLSGKKDFKNLFLFNQIINLSYYGSLIICIFIAPHVVPLIFINFLLSTLANTIVYFLVLAKYKPQKNNDPEALSYGKKLSLSNILPMLALNIDNLAVFHFLGPIQLAIYAFASNIPERLGGLLRPISAIALPKLATKQATEIADLIPKKTFQLFLLSLIGGIFYILMAPLIFKIFFPGYTSSIIYSQFYVLAIIVATSASLPQTALFATRSKNIFTFNIITPILNIAIICASTYFFGLWGTIWGRIIGNTILFIICYYFTQHAQKI